MVQLSVQSRSGPARAGKLEEAIASFEKTTAIYPSHAWSYAQWGAALAAHDLRDRGAVGQETAKTVEQKLKRAVGLKPNDKIVLETVSEAYGPMDRHEQANDSLAGRWPSATAPKAD